MPHVRFLLIDAPEKNMKFEIERFVRRLLIWRRKNQENFYTGRKSLILFVKYMACLYSRIEIDGVEVMSS
jgi:hypothetical protein